MDPKWYLPLYQTLGHSNTCEFTEITVHTVAEGYFTTTANNSVRKAHTKLTFGGIWRTLTVHGVLQKCVTYHSIPAVGSSTGTSANDFVYAFLVDGCIAF